MNLSVENIQKLKTDNDIIRQNIRDEALKFDSQYDKIACICEYFFKNYTFDYSILKSFDDGERRRIPYEKRFESIDKKSAFFGSTIKMIDPDPIHKIPLSPSLHALKMGTCASFSAEFEWFAKELGIECKKINVPMLCYDGYKAEYFKPKLRDIAHYYVLMNLDDKVYKIDIAGALMAKDYKKDNPGADICPRDFILVDKDKENPFEAIKANQKQ